MKKKNDYFYTFSTFCNLFGKTDWENKGVVSQFFHLKCVNGTKFMKYYHVFLDSVDI